MRQAISDIFAQVNQDAEFRQKMEEGGYVLVDIGYDQAPEFMDSLGSDYVEVGKLLGLVK